MEKADKNGQGQGGGNPGQGGGNGGNPGQGGGNDSQTVTIFVNGKPKTVPKNAELTFWDVVKLAFPNPETGEEIQYTVQYTRGNDNKPSGSLVEGQTVKVKKDMEFDVTPTNRS